MEEKKIEQPTLDYQVLYDELISRQPEEVLFCGKKYKVGWLTNDTIRSMTHLLMQEGGDIKSHVKATAKILLNDRFAWIGKILYPIFWRYLYYIKNVNLIECLKVIDAGKKKVPQEAYFLSTMLLTGMRDTMMMMTKKEAKLTQAEQDGEQPTA